MNLFRLTPVCVLAGLLAAAAVPVHAAAGAPVGMFLTQTFRNSHLDQNGVRGSYLTSYTAVSVRPGRWDLRGGLSWLSWQDDGGSTTIPDDSGPGAAYLTLGRQVWRTRSGDFHGSGWLRLRGKVPLQSGYDATGSGEADWGGSLFASLGLGALSFLAEIGFLEPGSPTGADYGTTTSAAVSVSYLRPGTKLYPVAAYSASSAALQGNPAYGEWSLGLGAVMGRNFALSALYSRGTTAASPDSGVAVSAWFRL